MLKRTCQETPHMCTLGVFLKNVRPLESEAESELHWRTGEEIVYKLLKNSTNLVIFVRTAKPQINI